MINTELIKLDDSLESSKLLAQYFKLLDDSFEPNLSSYVNIDTYANKLTKNAYVSVLKEKGNFVGLFALYVNDMQNKTAFISSLGVMEKYKGLGYAQYLMEEAIDVARKANMDVVRFEVNSNYKRAIKFHEKCGFKSEEKTEEKSTFFMYMPLK